jgi:hypothetical protein
MCCWVENWILGSNKSYNLIKMCMCVYMVDGWWTPFCIWFSLLLLRFLRLGLCPFILFSSFCMPLSMFFIHSPWSLLNIFRERERVIKEQCIELYLWNGWGMDEMMGDNFRCRSSAYSGCVCDLYRGSMTSFSPRVTTIRQDSMKKSSSLCGG